ncbi:MAG: DUF3606 domain-containing protein [Pedobacter sp.]|nr:MAG: DUF3606 domain-containing protein [Pedobacter sp.]
MRSPCSNLFIRIKQKHNGNANQEQPTDTAEITERYSIEDDSDTLEPFEDTSEHREINSDDPKDLQHWADEFQINVDTLKSVIVLNGTSVRDIKKYLSI